MPYETEHRPVVDHLLTLQQSLVHYERMLSESHPTYLQNLRVDLIRARAKSDFAAFVLAIVSVIILPPGVIIGMCTLYAYWVPTELWNGL
jgi:magnesium transporter